MTPKFRGSCRSGSRVYCTRKYLNSFTSIPPTNHFARPKSGHLGLSPNVAILLRESILATADVRHPPDSLKDRPGVQRIQANLFESRADDEHPQSPDSRK